MECWAKDFLFFFSFLHVSSRWYPVGPSFHIVFLWSFTMIWFSFDLNLQRFSLHSRMFCKKDFRLLFLFFVVVLFLFLRFISAQTMRGTSFRPSRYFLLFSAQGKRKKKKKKSCCCCCCPSSAFFLLPLRWRPTCRSERVSDRTIKLKKGKKKTKFVWVRLSFVTVMRVSMYIKMRSSPVIIYRTPSKRNDSFFFFKRITSTMWWSNFFFLGRFFFIYRDELINGRGDN